MTRADLLVHQPHAAARGARDLAAAAVRARSCRATSRSSTRSTGASSTRCARAFPATTSGSRACRSSTSAATRPCAWRNLATVGQPHGQRRRGAALAAPARDGAARFRRGCTRSASSTSPTASRRAASSRLANPELGALLTESIGEGWQTRSRPPRRARALADDAGFRERFRAVKRKNKQRAGAAGSGATHGSTSIPASLFDAQCKRIHEYKRQHLAAPARRLALRSHRSAARRRRRAAHAALRRQGGARATAWPSCIIRLIHGVARRDRARPARARAPARGVRARLQRQERPAHLPGGRSLRADLDGGHGGVGHRQHEVRAERRAHHRHARRRQRRDPRRGRRRATSSSSA